MSVKKEFFGYAPAPANKNKQGSALLESYCFACLVLLSFFNPWAKRNGLTAKVCLVSFILVLLFLPFFPAGFSLAFFVFPFVFALVRHALFLRTFGAVKKDFEENGIF